MDNSQAVTPQDYYAVFQKDPRGHAVFNQLCSLFYDSDSFDADPYKHAFKAGKRDVLRFLINQCMAGERPQENQDE